ncbi:hypothetical protein G6F46_015011 [Rhizopus delemar]|nr:hypothetical protein G6F46_015011 [Rhizopus delemar]
MIGALLLAAPLFSAPPAQAQDGIGSLIDSRVVFPASASQGALVIGKVPAGSRVQYAGRQLRVSGYGSVVFAPRWWQRDRDHRGDATRLAHRTGQRRAAEDGQPATGDCRADQARTGAGDCRACPR